MNLIKHRLAVGIVLSLLTHILVFFSFGLLLQLHATIPKSKVKNLEVRLVQPLPPKVQPKPAKQLLTTSAPAQFKITQVPVQKTPDIIAKPPAPAVALAPPATGEVEGIAFPGAVATPFPGQIRSSNPFLNARTSQQNAARTYYQQAMEAQARQRTEFQVQLMVQQLQQVLNKALDAEPLVTGKCMLVESAGDSGNRLKCDSSALYERLHKEQKEVAGMLIALRGMGRVLNGFTAEKQAGKLGITLINEDGSKANKSLESELP
jgi:hypothetical protein